MKKLYMTLLTVSLLCSQFAFAGGDASKANTASCSGCHGKNGLSSAPNFPNLACQKETYLIKQLNDFKSGKRPDPMMASFAKPLSDSDIANLAAYYSQLPCGG